MGFQERIKFLYRQAAGFSIGGGSLASPAAGITANQTSASEVCGRERGVFEDVDSQPLRPPAQPNPPHRVRTPFFSTTNITCFLVCLVGSILNPYFLTLRLPASEEIEEGGLSTLPSIETPIDVPHDVAKRLVEDFATSLGLLGARTLLTAADFGKIQVFALPLLDTSLAVLKRRLGTRAEQTMDFLTWEMFKGSGVELYVATALQLVCSFAEQLIPEGQAWELPSTSEVDWGPQSEPVDFSNAVGWEQIVALTRQTEVSLGAAFAAVSHSDPHSTYLAECASRIFADTRPQLAHVPTYLRRLGDPLLHKDASSLPFTNRFTPSETQRMPRARQRVNTSYRPRSYGDIIDADALSAILAWLHIEHSNMVAIAAFGPAVRRVPNALQVLGFGKAVQPHDVLVIGQDQFLEQARGVIWDCRGFEYGLPAVPLDFDAPVSSNLNDGFIQDELRFWPDQEMVGFILDGVQFKAELPLQIVLGPHLVSLSKAWKNVENEIIRKTDLKYFGLHRTLPFLPMRDVPQGSTPRKYEANRDRGISDGGFPRKHATDKAGIEAISLNAAIGLKKLLGDTSQVNDLYDSETRDSDPDESTAPYFRFKWEAPEIKPQVQDKAWDDYVLRHAALLVFHEPLNGWTDDFADYFNQIPLAPSEYWTSCFSWWFDNDSRNLYGFDSALTMPLTYVSELRLGFGVSLSPNVAQRFAEAVVAVFRRRFDEQELALFEKILDSKTGLCVPYNSPDLLSIDDNGLTDVCRWIQERRRLTLITGRQELRRYSVHIYTDDPVFTVVGQDALLRALRIWHEVTKSFGLRMSIPRKRQVGPSLTWLGFNFYLPAGIVAVEPGKNFTCTGSTR